MANGGEFPSVLGFRPVWSSSSVHPRRGVRLSMGTILILIPNPVFSFKYFSFTHAGMQGCSDTCLHNHIGGSEPIGHMSAQMSSLFNQGGELNCHYCQHLTVVPPHPPIPRQMLPGDTSQQRPLSGFSLLITRRIQPKIKTFHFGGSRSCEIPLCGILDSVYSF